MNESPSVSVIMPAYNAEKFIAESIDSIINQNFTNWELIIINDGSTDDTAVIAKEKRSEDHRIRLVEHDSNKGLVETRNRGLKEAKGDFIANLDADDIATKNRLSVQHKFLTENTNYVMIGGACSTIDSKGKKIASIGRSIPNGHLKTLLLFSNYFINSTVMIRTKVAKKLSFETEYPPAEDYRFFTRLMQFGELGNIDEELAQYRIHRNNISQVKKQDQKLAISKIQEDLIQKLGLSPTKRELELHSNLVDQKSSLSLTELIEIETWLIKLKKANSLMHLYDQAILNYYCVYFLERSCVRCKKGFEAWNLLNRSFLTKALRKRIKLNFSFFAKRVKYQFNK